MKNILEKNQIDAYLYRTLQNMVARVIKHAVMFHNIPNARATLQAEIKIQVANSKFFIENNYQLYPVAKSHISTYIRNFFSYHLETALIQFLKKQYYVDNLDALLEASDPNYTKRKKIDAILEDTKKRNSCIPEEMYKEKKLEKFLEQVSAMPQEEEKVKKAWTALMGSLNPIEAKKDIKKQHKEEETKGIMDYGLEASILGDLVEIGRIPVHNNKFWIGKNFKFYDARWGGNGATGGRLKYALKFHRILGRGGNLLGAYSVASTFIDYKKRKISSREHLWNQGVNGIGFVGWQGALFNFSYNMCDVFEDTFNVNIQLHPKYGNPYYIKENGIRWGKLFEEWEEKPYKSILLK